MTFKRELFPIVPLPGTAYEPDESGWGLWWQREIAVVRPSLMPLFVAYMDAFSRTEEEATEFRRWAREFPKKAPRERFASGYDGFAALDAINAAYGTIKALSLSLLLAFDNLLTDLRIRLRGEKDAYCTDDGPELRYGVTVDRALDAAGNYLRHESEWRMHDYRDTWPEGKQLESIWTIAQLSTSMPIDPSDGEESYVEYTSTNPGPMILDLLCDYASKGPEATYDDAQSKVKEAGMCTIKATFEKRRAVSGSQPSPNTSAT